MEKQQQPIRICLKLPSDVGKTKGYESNFNIQIHSLWGDFSPSADEISTGLDPAAEWINRGLTVFTLFSLEQSYLDGLRFLNSAKYSLIATSRIQMKSHLTAGSGKYMPIYFRIGYNN